MEALRLDSASRENNSRMKYVGHFIPKVRRAECYKLGRLPESERTAPLPGHGALQHSTLVTVADKLDISHRGDVMRRLNKMFNVNSPISESALPTAARKGRAGKDLSNDPLAQGLKAMPVNGGVWYKSDEKYTDKSLAAKQQSKIAAYAKQGNLGTFKTRVREGHIYICKTAAEWSQQKGL